MGDEDEYYYDTSTIDTNPYEASDSSWWDSFVPDWDTVTDWGGQAWDYVTDTNIVGGAGGSGLLDAVYGLFTDDKGNIDTGRIAGTASGIASLAGMLGLIDTDSDSKRTGYQGEIPTYSAVRQRVGDTYDPTRRPGSGGQRYFSDVSYVAPENVGAAQESAIQQAATLRQSNIDNPAQQRTATAQPVALMRGGIARLQGGGHLSQQDKANAAFSDLDATTAEMGEQGITSEFMYNGNRILGFENEEAKAAYEINEILRKLRAGEITIEEAEKFMRQNQPPQQMPQPAQPTAPMGSGMAQGGIASVKPKGYYLGGVTDGMADKVPAQIDNQQPAALSDGEFVIPADVVSHLGNGNSNAGAQQLYGMMDNIRQARTGTTQQGKQINPNKFMPA